jgi:valine dehydrogenase (NAD+)
VTAMHTDVGVFGRSHELSARSHEQVVFCEDDKSGLKAIIAIHSTALGPALGGVRMYPVRRRIRGARGRAPVVVGYVL